MGVTSICVFKRTGQEETGGSVDTRQTLKRCLFLVGVTFYQWSTWYLLVNETESGASDLGDSEGSSVEDASVFGDLSVVKCLLTGNSLPSFPLLCSHFLMSSSLNKFINRHLG